MTPQLCIHSLSIELLKGNFLLDFYWHSQYRKHSYSCKGGGELPSGEQIKGYVNTRNSQIPSIGAIFSSTQLSHKAAKSMANELISQWCDKLQLACLAVSGCLLVQGRWSHLNDHPSTNGYHDNSQKYVTTKVAWTTFSTNTAA